MRLPMNQRQPTPVELPVWYRSTTDEMVNAVTHGFGLLLAIVGALVMVSAVMGQGDIWRLIGCSVYLASLVAVYAMSTLSHTAMTPRWKSLFRALDQGFIYLLIVATYTPFSLAYLRGSVWGWVLLAAMWAVALFGFASKVFFAHRVEAVSIASYVLLGWMPMIAAPTLLHLVPAGAFWWMFLGGVCYTVGTIFLMNDYRVRHLHAVWHVCVIAGSACHFAGILFFVVGGLS